LIKVNFLSRRLELRRLRAVAAGAVGASQCDCHIERQIELDACRELREDLFSHLSADVVVSLAVGTGVSELFSGPSAKRYAPAKRGSAIKMSRLKFGFAMSASQGRQGSTIIASTR
jgi:hypothetical protein